MAYLLQCVTLTILLNAFFANPVYARAAFNEGYLAAQDGNYQKAVTLWRPLAEEGDPAAQYTLGWMYESGQGITQSIAEAIDWYTKAAQQDYTAAQYVLASIYSKGTGVPENQQLAVKWLLKAARQGDVIAQFQLAEHLQKGLGITQSDSKCLFWLNKAAQQGYLFAQIKLGRIYESATGTAQNYPLAIKWFAQAAQQGAPLAQFYLAGMYEYGRGTSPDNQQAIALYLKSAAQGYAPAAYKIAAFYEQGKGVARNIKTAVQWYEKAANKGDSDAQFKLGQLYQNEHGITQNIYNAISWYKSAAQQNHPAALYQLGLIYEQGINDTLTGQTVNINKRQAAKYYQRASLLDYNLAHARLAQLYEKGSGVAVDLQRALTLYQKSDQQWAKVRFNALSEKINCFKTATTKLFSVAIACTNRNVLRQKIKAQHIPAIAENNNSFSDRYFTGAAILGSSELEVTYTKEQLFISAKYTYVGRDKPALISHVKQQLIEKYGAPHTQSGNSEHGKASFQWMLADHIELTLNRDWPDTTTFVTYASLQNKSVLANQQNQTAQEKAHN